MSAAELLHLAGSPRLPADLCGADGDSLLAWQTLLEREGGAGFARVKGDFSVAVRLPDGRVFFAVDRFAIRPLCYRTDATSIAVSPRADELAGTTAPIRLQSLYEYLYFHVIPSPATVFESVLRLPPAHYGIVENGHLSVAPYWVPAFAEPAAPSFPRLREEFLDLLAQATARQLGDGKAACFLSGGTDSSTVAGMIGKVRGQPAASYSIGFEAEGYDEMAYARIAAGRFNTEHHEYYVTPDDLVRSIPAVASFYDQPFGNSSALPAFYCARMAQADGVTRILAGDGGDELFGGNTRYAKQRVFDAYRHLPAALRRGLMEPLFGTAVAAAIPGVKKASSYVQQARIPMPDRAQLGNLLSSLGLTTVLGADLLAAVDVAAPVRQQRAVWQAATTGSEVNRALAYDWRYTLAECDLPKVCGTTAMARLAVGFPMLDDELLAFSLRLPAEYKLKGLRLRWFFKEALRGFLPDEIIVKKKQGFGLPFGVWATRHPPLRQLALSSLQSLAERGVLRHAFVNDLFARYLAEHPGYYGEMIWIAMMLEQWLQVHRPDFSVSAR